MRRGPARRSSVGAGRTGWVDCAGSWRGRRLSVAATLHRIASGLAGSGGAGVLFGAADGAFVGFFLSVGVALDAHDVGAVHEAVDQGDDAGAIGEYLAPVGKGAVGGNQGAVSLVAAVDELEQQVGASLAASREP